MIVVSGNGNAVRVNGNASNSSIYVGNGRVVINGVDVGNTYSGIVEIRLEGDVANITTDTSVTVSGSCKGNIKAGGSITCGNVGGSVNAGGSIRCDKISGDVNAGGSVRHG